MEPSVFPNPEYRPIDNRRDALVEMLYLLLAIWLYVTALAAPLVGIIVGIVFMSAGRMATTKRMGRVCLILGIINAVFLIGVFTMLAALGGLAARLPFMLWEGM